MFSAVHKPLTYVLEEGDHLKMKLLCCLSLCKSLYCINNIVYCVKDIDIGVKKEPSLRDGNIKKKSLHKLFCEFGPWCGS